LAGEDDLGGGRPLVGGEGRGPLHREHAIDRLDQGQDNLGLGAGDRDVIGEVDHALVVLGRLAQLILGLTHAQQRADGRHQHRAVHRVGQVRVGAALEPTDL
jgi:hypothetical protein